MRKNLLKAPHRLRPDPDGMPSVPIAGCWSAIFCAVRGPIVHWSSAGAA